MITEIALSQGPALQEYAEMARTYWNASRHPQNLHDIAEAAKESIHNIPLYQRGVMGAVIGLEIFELSPGNETLLTNRVSDRFIESGFDIPSGALEAAKVTGALEGALALGAVFMLSKFKPVVEIIRKRYVRQHDAIEDSQETIENGNKVARIGKKVGHTLAKAGRMWSLAVTTGAFGSAGIEDVAKERKTLGRFAVAGTAAALIVANNTTLATGVMHGMKSDVPLLKDACELVVNNAKNPLVIGGVLAGLRGLGLLKERQATIQRLEARQAEADQLNTEAVEYPEIQDDELTAPVGLTQATA